MERALAVTTVEHAVTGLLLPALGDIVRRHGTTSTTWAFAARWAEDWLGRIRRLTPNERIAGAVMIADCSRDAFDLDAVHERVLELFCQRAGLYAAERPGVGRPAACPSSCARPSRTRSSSPAAGPPAKHELRWEQAAPWIAFHAYRRTPGDPRVAAAARVSPLQARAELAAATVA